MVDGKQFTTRKIRLKLSLYNKIIQGKINQKRKKKNNNEAKKKRQLVPIQIDK